MTSPVDTSVKFFRSSMSGAPVLTAQPGSLIALLDALLLNGFDTKVATSLTVADGVATLAFTGSHSAELDTVIAVSGVTGSLVALNGEQKVTAVAPGVVKFATAAANGTAAGTASFKMAPVGGWVKAFTGTNKAVYRSLAVGASGLYVRVDDAQAGGQWARARGYETMTDIDTGAGPFPRDVDMSTFATNDGLGGFWTKGANVSTNSIGYVFFADQSVFMFGPFAYQSLETTYGRFCATSLMGFGDMVPLRAAGDPYAVAIAVKANTSNASYASHGSFNCGRADYGAVFVPRDYTGSGVAQKFRNIAYGQESQVEALSGAVSALRGSFPSPIDGSLMYAKRYLRRFVAPAEADFAPRCDVPGVLSILQSGTIPAMSVDMLIYGSGEFAGRRLLPFINGEFSTDTVASPQAVGICLMDVTGPWR